MALPFPELVAACLEDLDDDEPRLVWADAVGGERGELVVLQCRLARGGLDAEAAGMLRRRQRDLLARHGAAWSGLGGGATRVRFRRGFVEAVEMNTGRFVEVADAEAPFVRSLTMGRLDLGGLAALDALLAAPAMRRLTGLATARFGTAGPSAEELVLERAAAAGLAPHVVGIADLDRAPSVARRGLLGQARRLIVEQAAHRSLLPLLARGVAPALAAFETWASPEIAHPLDFLDRLPDGLRELVFCPLQGLAFGFDDLPERFAALERVVVHARIPDPTLFGRLPRLRALGIPYAIAHGTRWHAWVEALVATPLPHLRELALPVATDRAMLDAILDALGPQLEVLDLRRCAVRDAARAEARIPGIVLVDGDPRDPLALPLPVYEPDTTLALRA